MTLLAAHPFLCAVAIWLMVAIPTAGAFALLCRPEAYEPEDDLSDWEGGAEWGDEIAEHGQPNMTGAQRDHG